MVKQYVVDRGCSICRTCIYLCPADAIVIDGEGAHIDPGKCAGCGKCFDNCPSEAISAYGASEGKRGE